MVRWARHLCGVWAAGHGTGRRALVGPRRKPSGARGGRGGRAQPLVAGGKGVEWLGLWIGRGKSGTAAGVRG